VRGKTKLGEEKRHNRHEILNEFWGKKGRGETNLHGWGEERKERSWIKRTLQEGDVEETRAKTKTIRRAETSV